jgi:dihydrofolate reductase
MSVSLIYARSLDHCIGKDGRIPWHLPDEFGHFKKTTLGKPIIMGRKTYEDHESALPGRRNIVISRQPDYKLVPGIELAASLDDAIALAHENSDEVFVIGGVYFFVEALPQANCVYETIIQANIDGEALLPEFDFSDWQTTLIGEHEVDERHAYAYKIYCHQRTEVN